MTIRSGPANSLASAFPTQGPGGCVGFEFIVESSHVMSQSPSQPQPRREFVTTRWSVVLRAGGTGAEQVQAALEQLCTDYWYPLYAYVRRKGHSPEDASDLTQEFFARLLAKDFAQGLTPEGGRFRSFLLTAINRFLIDEWRKEMAARRGGNTFIASLETLIAEHGETGYAGELVPAETPERIYQRTWAETLCGRVLQRLRDECASRMGDRFQVIEPFLSFGSEPPELAVAAAQLGLSLSAFKSQLHRLRGRYRELLQDEVAQTVGEDGDVAGEIRGLIDILRGN